MDLFLIISTHLLFLHMHVPILTESNRKEVSADLEQQTGYVYVKAPCFARASTD